MSDEIQQDDQNQNNQVSVEKLQADLDSAMNGWKRVSADFENYKRRKEEEIKDLIQFAREVTVAKLLPTLDSLEQALRHMPEYKELDVARPFMGNQGQEADESARYNDFDKRYENWQKGIEVLLAQLDKTLAEMGVSKIEALGKKFDPNFHEALREVESERDEGMVVEELQSGFILNGKVIRPSQVVISKKK